MTELIDIETFLDIAATSLLLDVRAPAEYKNGHIPGAINFPLFTDEERKIVGKKYTKVGRMQAVMAGLDFVGPKMKGFVKEILKISAGKNLLVYCWRGGMRSEAMMFILKTAGFKIQRLKNGYKDYRRHIHESFEKDARFIVLGGMTGSGKTALLEEIGKLGKQVLDLEAIACHKGSAFGTIGQSEQPSTEQFENNLYETWKSFDLTEPIWVEDESLDIGKVKIPYPIYLAIRNHPVIVLNIERELRAKRLVTEYTGNDQELKDAFERISKRIGGLNLKNALEAIDRNEYHKAAMTALEYYDKAYNYGIEQRKSESIFQFQPENDHPGSNAIKIIQFAKESGLLD